MPKQRHHDEDLGVLQSRCLDVVLHRRNHTAVEVKYQCLDHTSGSTSTGNVVQTWAYTMGGMNQVWTTTTSAATRRVNADRGSYPKVWCCFWQ